MHELLVQEPRDRHGGSEGGCRDWGRLRPAPRATEAASAAWDGEAALVPTAELVPTRACGGRMTVRAVVTDADASARLLGALRRSRDPPAAA